VNRGVMAAERFSEIRRNFVYVQKNSFTLRINRSLAAGSEGIGKRLRHGRGEHGSN
jgi:hypothetical protein